MGGLAVRTQQTPEARRPLQLQVALAFFAIYFLWGSTYLAIRVAVERVPPLFAAGVRFTIAGVALYAWARARGAQKPSRAEWRNLSILGAFMFLGGYAGLFWAEEKVPSGVASVLVAALPIWTALLEIFGAKTAKLTWRLVAALCLGFSGVAVLAIGSGNGGPVNVLGCLAIVGSSMCWSIGTVWSKHMALPKSKLISAGGQMLTGGGMLLGCSALAGELHPLPHVSLAAAAAIGYLIVAGSLLAFTAFVWLLGRMPATRVASYAYVNPVVALLIGYWLGNEALTVRTLGGAALILVSVLLILKNKSALS
jgi:drug/metabolite transporter (DMT)-like permease